MNEERFRDVREIIEVVAADFGVTADDILRHERTHSLVEARLVAYGLSRTLTRRSLPELGCAFRRDHTTVLHGVKKLTERMRRDVGLATIFYRVKRRIGDDRRESDGRV